jgi:hypothetical protein
MTPLSIWGLKWQGVECYFSLCTGLVDMRVFESRCAGLRNVWWDTWWVFESICRNKEAQRRELDTLRFTGCVSLATVCC